jgi:4,5-DOPA dioxygenase extradiol
MSMRAPVVFVSHGSPMLALATEHPYARALGGFAAGLPVRPRAVLALSAHWQTPAGVRVTAQARPGTLHDFAGFPAALFAVDYPAPGDPALAAATLERLAAAGLAAEAETERGLDHGVWSVLRHLFPEAEVPVVQVSLPMAPPADLFRLGEALRPLRDEGVMILASGGLVHNLRALDWGREDAPVEDWARDAEAWIMARVAARRLDELFATRETWPPASRVAPTSEHFDPLFVALGGAHPDETPTDLIEAFQYGSLSLRSFAYGA